MSKKRRKFSGEFKFETVMEAVRGEKNVAQICRERDITESLLYKWRDAFFERAPNIIEDQRRAQTDGRSERIAELERLAGKQALEIEILKKAGGWLGSVRERNGR